MTGYTVHTGSNDKFSSGWDAIFGKGKPPAKDSAQKQPPASTGKKSSPPKKARKKK